MDVTLLPSSAILPTHPLLPSPFANRPGGTRRRARPSFNMSALNASCVHRSPFTMAYRRRKFHEPSPPCDGSSPLDQLPDEVLLTVFGYLEWDEVLSLQSVCRRWSNLALFPGLYTSLALSSLPPFPLPAVLERFVLKSVKQLHLHLFPYPTPTRATPHPTAALLALLSTLPPGHLDTLSLPFSAPYLHGEELGDILRRIGGKLTSLDLRGSGLVGGRWVNWIKEIGRDGGGVKNLDVAFTSISTLPLEVSTTLDHQPIANIQLTSMPYVDPFRNLRSLSLASCSYLPETILTSFLAHLPASLEKLDLSRLDAITFSALMDMRITYHPSSPLPYSSTSTTMAMGMDETKGDFIPTKLTQIKLVGIDHLTRVDIRRLKKLWEEQRRSCFLPLAPHSSPISPTPRKWSNTNTTTTMTNAFTSAMAGDTGLYSPPTTPTRLTARPEGFPRSSPSDQSTSNIPTRGLPTPPPSTHNPSSKTCVECDGIHITIIHSALLETEDEAGYRQFIGEVVSGTLGTGVGLGLGRVERDDEARVEVDGGGLM